MGRPKLIDPSVRMEVRIPQSIHDRVMATLPQDLTGKVQYGALGSLITKLLREHLAHRDPTPSVDDLLEGPDHD